MTDTNARQMYILVNVANHQELVGDIVTTLVNTFNVPLNVVADIQLICPKCNPPCSASTINGSGSSGGSDESEVKAAKRLRLAEHNDNGSEQQQEQEQEPAHDTRIAIKTEQVDEMLDEEEMLGTVLAALQNGAAPTVDTRRTDSGSEHGSSSSQLMFDADDDDYKSALWANPDFLTSFITSQPNIFAAAVTATATATATSVRSGGGSKTPEKIRPSTSSSSSTPTTALTASTTPGSRTLPMLTVNGKMRRGRIVYTTNELDILEKYYEEDPNACADPTKREMLCQKLNIDYHRLKVWFQNRRRKDKVRSQEEQQSSAV